MTAGYRSAERDSETLRKSNDKMLLPSRRDAEKSTDRLLCPKAQQMIAATGVTGNTVVGQVITRDLRADLACANDFEIRTGGAPTDDAWAKFCREAA
jgi:hypothetical protein